MKKTSIILVLAAFAAALAGCKSQYELLLEGNDSDAKYKTAFELFEQGKYQKAARLFESLSMVSQGTSREDTVQYYWGLSNYKYKDYYTAESNFDHFIENFPRSPFTSDAKFYKIDCLFRATLRYELDQTPSYKAITAISEYLIENPTGEKADICHDMLTTLGNRLDRKAYENALLYYKMEEYKAAQVALRNVLKDDSENIYREEILYYIAMASYKYANLSVAHKQKERFLVFIDDYYNFIGEYPDSDHRKELETLYNKVKQK